MEYQGALDALRKARDALDVFDLRHPEVALFAEEAFFMEGDAEAIFGADSTVKPDWLEFLIQRAHEIIEAESPASPAEWWERYQRRGELTSPRIRRALEILAAIGDIDDPEVLADEDEEEDDEEDD